MGKKTLITTLLLLASVLNAYSQSITAIFPKNEQVTHELEIVFQWNILPQAMTYELSIGLDANFSEIIFEETSLSNMANITLPTYNTYYWKVAAKDHNNVLVGTGEFTFKSFSPSEVPDLLFWLDPAENITLIEGRISNWNAVNDTNISFLQNSFAKRPNLLNEISINNRPIVRFDGTDDNLLGEYSYNGSELTSFLVQRINDYRVNTSGISLYNTTITGEFTTNQTISLSFQDGAALQVIRGVRRPKYAAAPTTNWINNKFSFLTANISQTSIRTYRNNLLFETLPTSDNFNFNRITLGSRGSGGSGNNFGYMNTDLAEVLVYGRSLSPSEQALIHQYFQSKYSPPVNLGADISSDTSFCTIPLDAGERFVSYLWNTGATTQTIEVNTPGTYSVTVTDIFGFVSYDEINISFPDTRLSYSSSILCLGESQEISLLLSNPELYNFEWSTGDDGFSIVVGEQGSYWVKITDNQDCIAWSDTLHLTIDEFSSLFHLGGNQQFCSGNILSIPESFDIQTYQWSTGETTQSIIITESGLYSVTVTNNNGCLASDQAEITVTGIAPNADFLATTACFGSETFFTDLTTLQGEGEILYWLWDFGDGNQSEDQNPSHEYLAPGIYNVTLLATATGDCSNFLTSSVEVLDIPSALFTVNPTCVGVPAAFQDITTTQEDNPIVEWFWIFEQDITSTDTNPVHIFNEPGIYDVILTVTAQNSCQSSFINQVEVFESFPNPEDFSIIFPKQDAVYPVGSVPLQTNLSINATSFFYEIASDIDFSQIVMSGSIVPEEINHIPLLSGKYFARIFALNICLDPIASEVVHFEVYSPAADENLLLWLKASNAVVSGNNVSQWPDTINNILLNQLLSNSQPKLLQETEELNGNPFIRFDGINDNLAGNFVFNGEELTSFVIQRINSYSLNTSGLMLFNSEIPGEFTTNQTISLSFQDGAALQVIRGVRRPKYAAAPTTNWVNNKFSFLTANISQTSIRTFRNNLLFETLPTSENFNFNRITLGSRGSGVNGANFGYMNTDIAEVIIFGRSMSQPDQNRVIEYLRQKYSPPINLGPDRRITYGFCPQILDAGERFVSYLWNTGATTQTIEVNTPGTYSVTVTDIFGFQSSDSLQVRMTQTGLNASQVLLCEGESVELEFVSEELRAGAQAEVPRAEQFGIRSLELSGASTRGSSNFHKAGRPSPYTFLWSTGETTPSIITGQPGTYTLTVTDTLGCSRQFTATVQVDFFASTASLGEPRPFCMGDTLFVQSEWNPSDLVHAWADGSTEPFLPIHQPGTYQVTVTNPSGCVAQVATTLSFQGYAPVADFTAPPDCLGEATVFTGTATVEGSEIVSYQWFFGDPGNEVAGDTGAQVSYTYSQAGLHPATLQVESAAACRRSITRPVQVYHLPEGWFTPNNACSDVPVVFSDASTDQEGGIGQWQWSFFDGQGNLLGQSQQPAPSFTFADPGNHRIALEVASLVGCRDSLSRMINVRQSPEVDFSFTTPCLGEAVFFTDHTTAPPWALVSSQQWDFGDGNTSPQSNPSHLYAAGGIYNVTLSVTALNGCRPSLTLPVTVHSPPQADFAAPGLCQNTPHTFQDLSTVENSSISQWQWNFAGQGTSTLPDPEFTFSQPGQYAVSLVATSQAGCTGSITQLVDVYPAPEPQFTFFPRYGVAPLNVSFSNLSQGASNYVWDFGDGTPTTTQANPVHTFTQNGIYITRLTALSELGCQAATHQEIRVIPLSIDVAVQQLSWQQQGGFLQISALLSNQGTLEFDTLWLEVQLSGRDPIREKWTGLLRPGELTQHTFAAQFPWRDSYDFFCVEAYIPRLEQDDNPANNRKCLSFTQDFRLLTPWPNPAQEVVNLGFVLPLEDQVLIQLSDLQGNLIATLYNQPTPRGITTLRLPLPPLSSGIYLYRITYRDETRVGRVMVR